MLLNAYDTTVGRPIALNEQIKGTIRTLALMDDLVSAPKEGVYFIDFENAGRLPLLMFPLSVQSHDRRFITVLDRRPFINRKGEVINTADYSRALVTAYVQQDLQMNKFNVIQATRGLCVRGYARSLSQRIGGKHGLDMEEKAELLIFLAAFQTYQSERQSNDYELVALNVIRSTFGVDRSIAFPLIQEMGYIDSLSQFVDFIANRDGFFKLKGMTLKDFLALGSTIWFSTISRHIMGAALEHVPSFIGVCYSTVTNKMYQRTTLGEQLDPKYNADPIESFVKMINTSYPLGQ